MASMRLGGTVVHTRMTPTSLSIVVILGIIIVCVMFLTSDNSTKTVNHPRQVLPQDPEYDEGEEYDTGASKDVIAPVNPDRGPSAGGIQNIKPLDSPRLPMVMDRAKAMFDHIATAQLQYIGNHKRPPDHIYNINVTLSDSISLDRTIEDTRQPICRQRQYNISELPTASVVIPFYDEALTMLLRTVHSVLNRSPDILLEEVILVDDKSTKEYLQKDLDQYLSLLPKVKLLRNKNREGLIKSRMNGARAAKGRVVIFLDAHTEANEGWLEPLLWELKKQPESIIQPFVDGIDAWSLEYSAPPTYYRGAFSWDLRYVWIRVPDITSALVHEYGVPFPAATLVGCALAVDMEYFKRIGYFDEELKVWGGENLELAFRTWMCGGRVVTVPCSRVGHIFKNFPYKFDGDKDSIVQKNLIRVAEVWMDDYKKYFYASTRIYDFKRVRLTEDETRSLAERRKLREQLKCNTFEWYMHEILPEVEAPPMDSVFYGEIMSLRSRACFEVLPGGYIGMTYYCYEHKIIPINFMRINKLGLLQYKDRCVAINPPYPALQVTECPRNESEATLNKFGRWSVEMLGQTHGFLKVQQFSEGKWDTYCITQVTNVLPVYKGTQMPQISSCDKDNEFQYWAFTHRFDFDNVENDYVDFSIANKVKDAL